MRRKLWIAGALAAALVVPAGVAAGAGAATPPGLHVADGRLVEKNGSAFVFRGVNHAHTWYAGRTQSFADMAALGSNSVRTVLSSGDRWTRNDVSDVKNVVRLAKDAKMISILEVHDTTGYGEQAGAITLDKAVDYWISIKDAVQGQEDYVLLNIGNEPYGNSATAEATYVSDNVNAIKRLRSAGFANTIVVDAPTWGQDYKGQMRDNAAAIFAGDPDANVLFSVHMYGVYDTAQEIKGYFDAFRAAGLPLIVGEFGNTHSDGDVDEDTILAEARARGIGWLGWSWSGNGGGVEYLDLVTGFDPAALSTWGQRLFNGANGIKATSTRASIFSGSTPTPTPTPTGGCTAALSVVGTWAGGFQAAVTVTAGPAAISSWATTFSLPSASAIGNLWSARTTSTSSPYTVTNEAWNGSLAAGQASAFGFVGSGPAPSSSTAVTCTTG